MLSPEPSRGIRLLDEAGLLEIFFPELTALKGVDRVQGVKHKDNFYHTLTVLDTLSLYSQDLWLRWAALLHDIGKPATKKYIQGQGWTFYGHNHVGERLVGKIFNRLKLPQNEKMKYVQKKIRSGISSPPSAVKKSSPLSICLPVKLSGISKMQLKRRYWMELSVTITKKPGNICSK